MKTYKTYIVDSTEVAHVVHGLQLLKQHRVLNKFAKANNISSGAISELTSGVADLNKATLTVYNKIVSNLDKFLSDNGISQSEVLK